VFAVTVAARILDGGGSATVEVRISRPFMRGDCGGDGVHEIGDAIRLLSHLFSDGAVGCRAACDADASGDLTIGDAVGILEHLFSAGALPPPSGCDDPPVATPLSCDVNPCAL
ncbi:MAG: hypothetical protein JXP34_22220, partial [Planctomycetes bacterium]|nr:hypothetical protein [Planctomycetota bacterium]